MKRYNKQMDIEELLEDIEERNIEVTIEECQCNEECSNNDDDCEKCNNCNGC
jgi:hypothetical protein